MPISVESIHAYITQNYKSIGTNEELAETFHISINHLIRLFKKRYDSTPLQYVQLLRLQFSIELIWKEPQIKLCDAACLAGFSDALYYSKVFKKYCGMNPSVFRRLCQQRSTEYKGSYQYVPILQSMGAETSLR